MITLNDLLKQGYIALENGEIITFDKMGESLYIDHRESIVSDSLDCLHIFNIVAEQ